MRYLTALVICFAAVSAAAAELPPFLDEKTAIALSEEISGEAAKRNLEFLSRLHRMRGSRQFRTAAEHIESSLKSYGFEDAHIEQFPADGKIYYGTQRSRPAWNAEFAELWDVAPSGQRTRLASWDAMPITLAQDSESANVTTELVDVGSGVKESDYTGKDVAGKIVLASSQADGVARLAVMRFGAVGIVSYAQNQKTAWSGENENLVRWGHLDTFAPKPSFAFMVSLKQARAFQQRLAARETIRLNAVVRAGRSPGSYDVATATIPGADPKLARDEIVYSCHLDHPRPGANDNASGCVTILEVARSLNKLIAEKRLAPPARTIRFVWPAEIEGSLALLNGNLERTKRIKAAIHLDMVGGGPETKAIFHVTRGPGSLPSFIHDVAGAIGQFVNDETAANAKGRDSQFPLTAPEGGKEALLAELAPFSLGSDHAVYQDSSFAIPAIYLNDWPDRYIHTNYDVPANIDPTKLKRAAFIAASAGYVLANLKVDEVDQILDVMRASAMRRAAAVHTSNSARYQRWYEEQALDSLNRFASISEERRTAFRNFLDRLNAVITPGADTQVPPSILDALVFRRNPAVKGPMSVFGYDYFEDKYGAARAAQIALLGLADGHDYAYEVLNLVDGQRTARQITNDVSAIYRPVSIDMVVEYLRALESIGVVSR